VRRVGRAALAIAGAHAFSLAGCHHPEPSAPPSESSSVTRLAAPRLSPNAYGRAGDLMLDSKALGVMTFATSPDAPGHRPLRGALVDVGVDAGDHTDPLLTWRSGWRGGDGAVHLGPLDTVDEADCHGSRGVHLAGVIDGVHLDTTVCSIGAAYRATTVVLGLPEGAAVIDEVNGGTSHALAQGAGASWDGDRSSPFFGLVGDEGVGWLLESPQMRVVGRLVRIGEQAFQTPFVLSYPGTTALRTFRVVPGDGFNLLSQVAAAQRTVHVGIQGARGQVGLLDESGKPMVLGEIPVAGRDLAIPVGIGADLAVYDEDGVEAKRGGLDASLDTLVAPPSPRADVSFHYVDDTEAPLPVHVTFRGLDGTRDPNPVVRSDASPAARTFAGGRSLYLVGGTGSVALPPGRYRVTASHGIRFTLSVEEIVVRAGESRDVRATLRDVYPSAPWTSGDFHLHAAPSPDAPVSLDARVASLVCEGVDLAVATDHNRVTDYQPSVARLGVATRIVTAPGDEITSYGAQPWGHFNVYPLPLPTGAPEAAASPYYNVDPAAIFAAAHAYPGTGDGASGHLVQVNHPRMDPKIGYFDLAGFDAKTGQGGPSFSADFDAVEAYNGFWITNPAKVREGAMDLVGLARRGLHVAVTGNSDSHHLLYEEAGYPRTYVHVPREPIATRKARVFEALRKHDTTVSSGPLVELTVDGSPIGSVVVPKVARSVRVHVRVTAPAWIPVEHLEIWQDDHVAFQVEITKSPIDGVRYEGDTVLAFPTDGTILAWASAETPLPDVLPYPTARAIGFTGLVYVDANGDGKVEVGPGK